MSDTPISDSTPHNVAELGMLCRRLERQLNDTPRMDASHYDDGVIWNTGRQLERELNAANAEVERLTNKVAQLYEGAEEQKQRIKRLEEGGDKAILNSYLPDRLAVWKEAKEAKL